MSVDEIYYWAGRASLIFVFLGLVSSAISFWAGMRRDELSAAEVSRVKGDNVALQQWIRPRKFDKEKFKSALESVAPSNVEIVLLPNVFDGEPVATGAAESFKELGWTATLASPKNRKAEELEAIASIIANPRGIILLHPPGYERAPAFRPLIQAIIATGDSGGQSKEDNRIAPGVYRILIAQKATNG